MRWLQRYVCMLMLICGNACLSAPYIQCDDGFCSAAATTCARVEPWPRAIFWRSILIRSILIRSFMIVVLSELLIRLEVFRSMMIEAAAAHQRQLTYANRFRFAQGLMALKV